jgi:ABC-type multidrug transport system fused ATPase/permease subunit
MAEMDLLQGRFDMPDRPVAYCAQNPWLQSASIRDNILFSTPYDEERYGETLNACELLPDMLNFPNGDLSLLGEK